MKRDAQRNVDRRTCGISPAMRDILDTASSRDWLAAYVFNDLAVQKFKYEILWKSAGLCL
ncbi:hypothetical protein [Acidovorax sp.]|uniref:hypothetical protein n=1 Tax=Acidovorax sp. TaxID=1872122 RepID=UPI003D0548D4